MIFRTEERGRALVDCTVEKGVVPVNGMFYFLEEGAQRQLGLNWSNLKNGDEISAQTREFSGDFDPRRGDGS